MLHSRQFQGDFKFDGISLNIGYNKIRYWSNMAEICDYILFKDEAVYDGDLIFGLTGNGCPKCFEPQKMSI